jgi:ketosteroid isomerase-like protein
MTCENRKIRITITEIPNRRIWKMVAIRLTLLIILFGVSLSVSPQSRPPAKDIEAELRQFDLAAAKAVLEKDEKGIAHYFTKDSVTNNPRNGLTIGSDGVIQAARANLIDYQTFERVVESVQILGNTVVIMGHEKVVMNGNGGNEGETIRRRYTNVWMKTRDGWRIVARHANVICG